MFSSVAYMPIAIQMYMLLSICDRGMWLSSADTCLLRVFYTEIECQKSLEYLGAELDVWLMFHSQITKKCQIAVLSLEKIKNIRQYLTDDACKTAVQ